MGCDIRPDLREKGTCLHIADLSQCMDEGQTSEIADLRKQVLELRRLVREFSVRTRDESPRKISISSVRCWKCGVQGHYRSECVRGQSGPKAVHRRACRRHAAGRDRTTDSSRSIHLLGMCGTFPALTAPRVIGDRYTEYVADTGASKSVLPRTFKDVIGLAYTKDSPVAVDGKQIRTFGTVTMNIALGNVYHVVIMSS